jgi:hypothetical protein
MPRLKLQTKRPEQKIQVTDTYIPGNDPANFDLLKDNRYTDEKFTRVDRYMINHYYLVGTEWLMEKIFYPSSYGFDEIDKEKNHPCKRICNELTNNGIGLYGDRPIPKINKPTSRIQLKSKPQRMNLSCKEKE